MNADRPPDVPGPVPELPGDLFDDIVSGEPGLGKLFGVLTSGPAPAELSGANDALAMFRAHAQPSLPQTTAVPGPLAPEPRGPGPRAPGAHASSPHAPGLRALRTPKPHSIFNARAPRRVAALAVTLAAAAALAVAAYTSTLPAPIQHAAYRVLGFAGIPDTRHGAAGALGAPHRAGQTHGAPGTNAGSVPSAGASPQPGASASASGGVPGAGQAGLSAAASSGRITSGGSDTFTGQLSEPGQAVAGVRLSLEERAAGQRTWRVAGSGVTNATGRATVTGSGLTRNAWFRFAGQVSVSGQSSVMSQQVPVIVVPPLSVSVKSGSGGRADVLTASSPLASPGDVVVLEVWSGARWHNVQARALNGSRQVSFMVRPPAKAQQYRAVLLGTVDHGTSVSATAVVPAR